MVESLVRGAEEGARRIENLAGDEVRESMMCGVVL